MASSNKKLKIAFIIDYFPRITETFILNQIVGLIDLGHQIEIYARYTEIENAIHQDYHRYNLAAKTIYLPSIPKNKFLCRSKALAQILKTMLFNPKKALKIIKILIKHHKILDYPTFYLLCKFKLHQNDIMMAHYGTNGNKGALLKILGEKAKLITMFHSYDLLLAQEQKPEIYHLLFDKVDKLLALSPYNEKCLIELGAKPETITTHPIGMDSKIYYPPTQKQKNNIFRIITVNRLDPCKTVNYAIEAFKILTETVDIDCHYTIVGDGPMRQDWQELTKKLDLQDKITFTGRLNQIQVAEKLRQSDVFLLTSIAEALPTSLIEAGASSLAVIGPDIAGVKYTMLPGETGFVVEKANIEKFAEKLIFLAQNPEIRQKMGQKGYQYTTEKYDIQTLNKKLETIFYQTLS